MTRLMLCAVERFFIGATGVALALTVIYWTQWAIRKAWRALPSVPIPEPLTRRRYAPVPRWLDKTGEYAAPVFFCGALLFMGSIALHNLGKLITDAMGWCHFAH